MLFRRSNARERADTKPSVNPMCCKTNIACKIVNLQRIQVTDISPCLCNTFSRPWFAISFEDNCATYLIDLTNGVAPRNQCASSYRLATPPSFNVSSTMSITVLSIHQMPVQQLDRPGGLAVGTTGEEQQDPGLRCGFQYVPSCLAKQLSQSDCHGP